MLFNSSDSYLDLISIFVDPPPDNKRSASIDNDVQKIIATAEMRKNQLLILLDEHAKIVQEIKMAETTK